jgi:hypothetical protein
VRFDVVAVEVVVVVVVKGGAGAHASASVVFDTLPAKRQRAGKQGNKGCTKMQNA